MKNKKCKIPDGKKSIYTSTLVLLNRIDLLISCRLFSHFNFALLIFSAEQFYFDYIIIGLKKS